MSEFFKALEQAERDRQLAEATERAAMATDLAEGTPLPVEEDGADAVRPTGRTPTADTLPTAAAAAPPVSPPAKERSVDGRRSTFFERPSSPVPHPVSPPRGVPPPAVADRAIAPTPDRSVAPAVPPPVAPPAPAAPAPAAPPPAGPVHAAPPPVVPAPAAQPPVVPAPAAQPPAASLTEAPPPIQRATTPPKKRSQMPVLIADLDPRSVAAEAYRTLRTNLEFGAGERACRNIIITSPSMGEGKSTTAANLAVVAAQGGTRVCLVDADMRRPALHKVFDVPNHGGFTRALSKGLPLSSVAIKTDIPQLSLVVAGSADGLRPAQLLTAPRLQRVMHDPGPTFDLVIFDTPPVLSVADAMNLAAHCDGVLLVVRAGAVTPSVLQRAVSQLTQVHGKVLGILLNQVDLRRGEAEYYRHYRAYYSTATKD